MRLAQLVLLPLLTVGCNQTPPQPTQHQSVALLQVNAQQAGSPSGANAVAVERFKQTQAAELTSDTIFRELTKRGDFASFGLITLGDFQSAVKVEFPGNADLMRVTVTSPDPMSSLMLAEATIGIYMQQRAQDKLTPNPAVQALLEKTLKRFQAIIAMVSSETGEDSQNKLSSVSPQMLRFSEEELELIEEEERRLEQKLLRSQESMIQAQTYLELARQKGEATAALEKAAAEATADHQSVEEHLQATKRVARQSGRSRLWTEELTGETLLRMLQTANLAIAASLQDLADEHDSPGKVTLIQPPHLLGAIGGH